MSNWITLDNTILTEEAVHIRRLSVTATSYQTKTKYYIYLNDHGWVLSRHWIWLWLNVLFIVLMVATTVLSNFAKSCANAPDETYRFQTGSTIDVDGEQYKLWLDVRITFANEYLVQWNVFDTAHLQILQSICQLSQQQTTFTERRVFVGSAVCLNRLDPLFVPNSDIGWKNTVVNIALWRSPTFIFDGMNLFYVKRFDWLCKFANEYDVSESITLTA